MSEEKMKYGSNSEIPKEVQEDVKELISTVILLPKEDRAVLLSNASALKVRCDIEKARVV